MAAEGFRSIDDARMLRAVAHPVRNRILAELSATGPMRAADIAAQIDVPANQASFHLRQLAKYGLVVEAPELARDRRDRVWRTASPRGWSVDLEELEKEPGGASAVEVFRQQAGAEAHRLIDQALRSHKDEKRHVMVSDHALRLTKAESRKLSEELTDLVEKWRARTEGKGGGRRTQRLLMVLQPYDDADGA